MDSIVLEFSFTFALVLKHTYRETCYVLFFDKKLIVLLTLLMASGQVDLYIRY